MKVFVRHPVYGEIIYDESFWSGKKTITVNGIAAQSVSKNTYLINGKNATLKGNSYTGISLCIENETVQLTPKPKWYELVLAILPLAFLLTWGNSAALCDIFPVVGGAIGGGLGGAGAMTSLLLMKKQESPLAKLLVGICAAAVTIFAAFAVALAILWLSN